MAQATVERPPYVVFERRTIEDRAESLKQKRYMEKNIDYAVITAIGSKDRIPREVSAWFDMLEREVKQERFPAQWLEQFKAAYNAWLNKQEIPVNGTPIKGWALISPAQQSNVISANILTVEDLAQANAEARGRIGMGANEIVEKAIAWLKSAKEVGGPASELAEAKGQVARLMAQNEAQRLMIEELKRENASLVALVPKEIPSGDTAGSGTGLLPAEGDSEPDDGPRVN